MTGSPAPHSEGKPQSRTPGDAAAARALGNLPPRAAQPHRRVVILTSNFEAGPSIHVLTFALPPDDPMEFVPGQYVTFYLVREGKSVTRSYSIYSSAHLHDRFSLLVKRVPHGFASNLLCDLTPSAGATETILAPLGKFLYRDPEDRRVLMVATGVGLAPFVPMLERLHERSPSTDAWLIWGNRYVGDMVGRGELEALAASWPRFHFVPVLSRPPKDGSWTGAVGHVQDAVRAGFPDLARADVYLCGATPMVNEMQDLAIELRCPKEHVFVDRWGEHTE